LPGSSKLTSPVRVDKVLLATWRRSPARSKPVVGGPRSELLHLPEVERLLSGRASRSSRSSPRRISRPSIAGPSSPRGRAWGVASAAVATAHNLEHSIANPACQHLLVGACPPRGAALGRLVHEWTSCVLHAAAERVRGLAGPAVQVMIDDRALDQRAIEMLAPSGATKRRQAGGRSPRRSEAPEPPPSNGANGPTAQTATGGARATVRGQ